MIIQHVAFSCNHAGAYIDVAADVMIGSLPTKGRLLVATPPLDDPNFDRTVIYMLEHHDDGALGVVINRPTEEDARRTARPMGAAPSCATHVFEGGPVEPDA